MKNQESTEGVPPQDARRQDDEATSDKARGAIFNMIGPLFRVVSGISMLAVQLSIEAVSDVPCCLKAENIQMTKEVSKFQLLKMEAERALER